MTNPLPTDNGQPFDPFAAFADKFTIAGDVFLDACPVCESRNFAPLWRLPQNKLSKVAYLDAPETTMNRLYLAYLPLLTVPQQVFCHGRENRAASGRGDPYRRGTPLLGRKISPGLRAAPASGRSWPWRPRARQGLPGWCWRS